MMVRKHVFQVIIVILLVVIVLLMWCFRDRLFQEKLKGEGTIMVKGSGKDLYYVYRAEDGEKVNFTSTGKPLTLPAGKYRVQLNNVDQSVTLRNGENQVLDSGVLMVDGIGLNLYEVWDEKDQNKLNFTNTSKGLELFSGSYTLSLNNVHHMVTVDKGDTTLVRTGQVMVSDKIDGLYHVFDTTGTNKLNFTYCGKVLEMLPGMVLVRWDGGEKKVEIKAGERVVVE